MTRPLTPRVVRALHQSAALIGVEYSFALSQYQAGLKYCHVCASWEPIASFYRKAEQWDGLHPRCIVCVKMTRPVTSRGKWVPTRGLAPCKKSVDGTGEVCSS